MLKQFVTSTLTVDSRASRLGQAAIDEGNVANVNKRYEQVRTVTADDLLRVAKKYLVPERVLIVKVDRNLPGDDIDADGQGQSGRGWHDYGRSRKKSLRRRAEAMSSGLPISRRLRRWRKILFCPKLRPTARKNWPTALR